MEPERPREKVPIPGTNGWLRVTTTHDHVFYAQKKTKRSSWTIPEEIREQVVAFERSLGIEPEEDEAPESVPDEAPHPKRLRTESPEEPSTEPTEENEAEPAAETEAEPPAPALSFEQGKAQYMAMLTSLNGTPNEINPMAPWDRELPKFVREPAYLALPTLQDREDVFNEWCKYRLREKRAMAQSASTEEAFEQLLRKQVASTRTTFEAFHDAFKNDSRYTQFVQSSSRARAEHLFHRWLAELGEKKRKLAQEAEQAFLALLQATFSPRDVLREAGVSLPLDKESALQVWSSAKKAPGLASDPRYEAAGGATRRFELFVQWLEGAGPSTVAPRRSAEERRAHALQQRAAQVHEAQRRHAHEARYAQSEATAAQQVQAFEQLLVDAVRDPWLPWEDAQGLLARPTETTLDVARQHALFEEHMERLRSKRRDQLAKLFQKHAQDARGVPLLDRGADDILPLVRADEAYQQSALPRFVGEDAGVHRVPVPISLESEFRAWDAWRQAQAREAFQRMLEENAFVDFWGRLRQAGGPRDAPTTIGDGDEEEDDATASLWEMASQVDLDAMESVLQVRD